MSGSVREVPGGGAKPEGEERGASLSQPSVLFLMGMQEGWWCVLTAAACVVPLRPVSKIHPNDLLYLFRDTEQAIKQGGHLTEVDSKSLVAFIGNQTWNQSQSTWIQEKEI